MKKVLFGDVNVRTEETISACIVEYDESGNISKKIELSAVELERELKGDAWEVTYWPEWIGGDTQRWRNEQRKS